MANYVETLISNTFRIAKYVAQVSQLSMEERTATIMQYHALSFLDSHANATLSEVADYLKASLSSATQLIERLHKSGFIIRNHDENDRRVIRLALTQDGKEKLAQLKETKKQRMQELLKNLKPNEIAELARIQKIMIETIQEK